MPDNLPILVEHGIAILSLTLRLGAKADTLAGA
jgi:hypothetical protein